MGKVEMKYDDRFFITYKEHFTEQTGIQVTPETTLIYLDYLKVLFANHQTDILLAIRDDIMGLKSKN